LRAFLNGTILVVNTEPSIREVFDSFLQSSGYNCLLAASALEALALLDSGKQVDVILSDVMMAEMDGIALLEKVTAKYSNLPLVFQTSCYDPALERVALKPGAIDYLHKPFTQQQSVALAALARTWQE